MHDIHGQTVIISDEKQLLYIIHTYRSGGNIIQQARIQDGAMGAGAPGPAVFRGLQFWEVQNFLCAVCEIYTVLQQKYSLICYR